MANNIKVLSYNVDQGISYMSDGRGGHVWGTTDFTRTANMIASFDADIALIQELPEAGIATIRSVLPQYYIRWATANGANGRAILSKYGFTLEPSQYPLTVDHSSNVCALIGRVRHPTAGQIVVCSAHLSNSYYPDPLPPWWDIMLARAYEVQEIQVICQRISGSQNNPVIIAGDMNTMPGQGPLELFVPPYYHVPKSGSPYTLDSVNSVSRELDHVIQKGMTVVEPVVVFQETAFEKVSDHKPIYCTLTPTTIVP